MPATMVMFRDGVSEGEFEYVKTEEGAAIKSAIDQLWVNAPKDKNGRPPPQPKLTFIVVGKRYG
jgi:eukaryotic translation initiation factor 2C